MICILLQRLYVISVIPSWVVNAMLSGGECGICNNTVIHIMSASTVKGTEVVQYNRCFDVLIFWYTTLYMVSSIALIIDLWIIICRNATLCLVHIEKWINKITWPNDWGSILEAQNGLMHEKSFEEMGPLTVWKADSWRCVISEWRPYVARKVESGVTSVRIICACVLYWLNPIRVG